MRYLLIALFLFPAVADAKRLHPERFYQELWCESFNGQMEVVLEDKSRVDCVTEYYAVEVDFANKWAEAHTRKGEKIKRETNRHDES